MFSKFAPRPKAEEPVRNKNVVLASVANVADHLLHGVHAVLNVKYSIFLAVKSKVTPYLITHIMDTLYVKATMNDNFTSSTFAPLWLTRILPDMPHQIYVITGPKNMPTVNHGLLHDSHWLQRTVGSHEKKLSNNKFMPWRQTSLFEMA